MADNKEAKPNKVIEILKTEYPIEKVLLGVLGLLVLVLGVYLVEGGILRIRYTEWWIFDKPLKVTIFSIFVILIGASSFLMAIWPFFVPSFSEMKKVSWPNKKTIANHSMRVFGFLIFLSLMFLAYDALFAPIFEYLTDSGVQ